MLLMHQNVVTFLVKWPYTVRHYRGTHYSEHIGQQNVFAIELWCSRMQWPCLKVAINSSWCSDWAWNSTSHFAFEHVYITTSRTLSILQGHCNLLHSLLQAYYNDWLTRGTCDNQKESHQNSLNLHCYSGYNSVIHTMSLQTLTYVKVST